MSKFNDLIYQIELFIRKYYKNEMIRGVILSLTFLLLTFLLFSVGEYIGRFSQLVRLVLFYSFLIALLLTLIKFIFIPLLKLNKLSKRLSLNEASLMIGSIFPDVNDKLKNTIELSEQLNSNTQSLSLIEASINQRSSQLSIIPFSSGINIKDNVKYVRYLLPVLFIILIIGIINPTIFSDSTKRIVNYDIVYIEKSPFNFELISNDTILEGLEYNLNIEVTGDFLPNEVKVITENGTYNLRKKGNQNFTHHFSHVDNSIKFYCEANGHKSKEFIISVLKKPNFGNLIINVTYPKHTGLKSNTFSDFSDLYLPEGSNVKWTISKSNASRIDFKIHDSIYPVILNPVNSYVLSKQLKASSKYAFLLSSKEVLHADTVESKINIIKDEFPDIIATKTTDSLNPLMLYFNGQISDDYGFSNLFLNVKINKKDSSYSIRESIGVNSKLNAQQFFQHIDISKYNIKAGEAIEFYFIVYDNDNLNGFKSSKSAMDQYVLPELSILEDKLSEENKKLKEELEKAYVESKKLNEEFKDIKNTLINKNDADWKDKQNLESLLNRQSELKEKIDDLNKSFENQQQQEDEFLENSEELKEKQELLEKLMEELMDDEMKDLLEELQKLLDEMNRDKLLNQMEQIEKKNTTLEEELDRSLELFKQLELEKKIENIEEQLRELSEEQMVVKEELEKKNANEDEVLEKQEKIGEKFEQIKKDIEDAKKLNENLDKPDANLDFSDEKKESISEELKQSEENLSNSKKKKAADSQSKTSKMMEEMADDISAMMASAENKKNSEDMDQLRFLLENLVSLSHQQEDLLENYQKINYSNPIIVDYNQAQINISKSTEIVKDSLTALAKRQPKMSSIIFEELTDLDYNLTKSVEFGQERRIDKVKQHQQYSITSYNDLALLLSEVLRQMQDQMKSKMPGTGSCDKPGGSGSGKPSDKMSMKDIKNQLKNQIGKMKNGRNPGSKPGEKPGNKPSSSGQNIPGLNAKDIAKMAAAQAQMRDALEKMRQELNKDGSGIGNQLNKPINDLKELENDLLNNGYKNEMINRQNDILSKLLESEKAIRERGYSEERISKSGNNTKESNLIDLIEYNKQKEVEVELLRTLPVGLKVYYKKLVNNYFNSVNQ